MRNRSLSGRSSVFQHCIRGNSIEQNDNGKNKNTNMKKIEMRKKKKEKKKEQLIGIGSESSFFKRKKKILLR